MKILVTVGTHDQGFDTLLMTLLPWIKKQQHEWIIQSGHSKIKIPNVTQRDFFSPEEMIELMQSVDLVISHMGCGIAREVQTQGVPALFMCRRRHRQEHVDDHQLELAGVLKDRPGMAFFDIDDDPEQLAESVRGTKPQPPEHLSELVSAVKDWLSR